MALNDASADTLGTAIAGALLGLPLGSTAEARWQAALRLLYDALKTDAVVGTTVDPGATANGVTAGAASVPVTGTTTGTLS